MQGRQSEVGETGDRDQGTRSIVQVEQSRIELEDDSDEESFHDSAELLGKAEWDRTLVGVHHLLSPSPTTEGRLSCSPLLEGYEASTSLYRVFK